jgi:UDP-N-acetylmuramate--alanine ligase
VPLLGGLDIVTAGLSEQARYRGHDVATVGMASRLSVTLDGRPLGELELRVPGLYNVHNALTATALCHEMGVPFAAIAEGLATFEGLENRFTLVAAGGVQVVKDYISHPTGIQRVLEAARSIAEGPITAVFKPYRFTMIHYLQDQYRDCFREAEHTIVTELYTAGEVPIPGVDTAWLCDKIREAGSRVTFFADMDAIVPHLQQTVGRGEQVIFFGGDDLFRLADAFIEWLRAREA